MSNSVSKDEISKFEQIAKDWWSPTGKFKALHDLTPIRLEYIINLAKRYFAINSIEDLNILDIGCGGGLVAEPLARLGAKITGIDASSVSINIAKEHADLSGIKINYQAILAEELVKNGQKFQLVLALEVLEHVQNIELFIETCAKLVAPGGLVIFSTINQSIKAYLQSIIAAEYILRLLPIGTHQWSKLVCPAQINKIASKNQLNLFEMKGLSYRLFSSSWELSDDVSNNYFIAFSVANSSHHSYNSSINYPQGNAYI